MSQSIDVRFGKLSREDLHDMLSELKTELARLYRDQVGWDDRRAELYAQCERAIEVISKHLGWSAPISK